MLINKKHTELEKDIQQLTGEYRDAFEQIVVHVRASTLTHKEEADLLAVLLDDFLRAQRQGTGVNALIEGNCQAYCEAMITSYLQNPRTHIRRRWNHAANLVFTLTALICLDFIFKNVIGGLVRGSGISIHYEATMNFVVIWIIALGVVWYILNNMKKNAHSEQKQQSRSERTILLLIMVSPLILVVTSRTMRLDQIVVFSANGAILLAVLALAYLICWRQANR